MSSSSSTEQRSTGSWRNRKQSILLLTAAVAACLPSTIQGTPAPDFSKDSNPTASSADDNTSPMYKVAISRKVFAEKDAVTSRFQRLTSSSFMRAASMFGGENAFGGNMRVGSADGSEGSDVIHKDAGYLKNLRDNTYNCHVELVSAVTTIFPNSYALTYLTHRDIFTQGNGQKFMVDLDTGSSDTWLRGPDCKSSDDSCNGHKVDTSDSNMRSLGVPFTTRYGQGYVKGKVYLGDLKIGEAVAKDLLVGISTEEEADGDTDGIIGLAYSSLSQIAKQTRNAIVQRKQKDGSNSRMVSAEDVADIVRPGPIKPLSGSSFGIAERPVQVPAERPAILGSELSGTRRWGLKPRDEAQRSAEETNLLSLVKDKDVSDDTFSSSVDSSKVSEVTGSQSNFVDALKLPKGRNMFGFYLSYYKDGDHGEVVFGGYDRLRIAGPVTWFKLNSPSYWQFDIKGFKYSVLDSANDASRAEEKPFWSDSVSNAISDTGTTLMILDRDVAKGINTKLGATPYKGADGGAKEKIYVIDCALGKKDGPIVRISSPDGAHFDIPPKAYVIDTGAKNCISGFSGAASNGVAIFGDVFLREHYSIYDRGDSKDTGRIGFAKAVHSLPEGVKQNVQETEREKMTGLSDEPTDEKLRMALPDGDRKPSYGFGNGNGRLPPLVALRKFADLAVVDTSSGPLNDVKRVAVNGIMER
ncbi:Vacuolar protease A [Phlyctochytrium planicorne]|nr:Vacuolar protease A [Phlyctochytrium planicorne]